VKRAPSLGIGISLVAFQQPQNEKVTVVKLIEMLDQFEITGEGALI
jgi:hypothetical protein